MIFKALTMADIIVEIINKNVELIIKSITQTVIQNKKITFHKRI